MHSTPTPKQHGLHGHNKFETAALLTQRPGVVEPLSLDAEERTKTDANNHAKAPEIHHEKPSQS